MPKSPLSIEELAKTGHRDLFLVHAITKMAAVHKDFKMMVENLNARMAELNRRGPPGHRGDKGESIVGPPGPPGRDGLDADEEKLEARLLATLTKKVAELAAFIPDEERIYQRLVKKIPVVKDGAPGQDAVFDYDALLEALKKRKIKPEHIDGLEEKLGAFFEQARHRLGYVHGGGDSVDAGNGITITTTSAGRKTISAAAASVIATERLTPTASGANITLDLTGLAHTFSSILGVYKNGQLLDPAATDFGWSRSSNTITVLNAVTTDTFLIQYTYA